MQYDKFGQPYFSEKDLLKAIYKNPEIDLGLFQVTDPEKYNASVKDTFADMPVLSKYIPPNFDQISIEEFDAANQRKWLMPIEYKELDIARWVLEQCKTQDELQRVGQELLMYQDRDLFDLLRYMKYFVDTMREHNIFWGVGRGSSVASYTLYLIGVHKVNSLYYDIPIEEFLK